MNCWIRLINWLTLRDYELAKQVSQSPLTRDELNRLSRQADRAMRRLAGKIPNST